MVQYKICLHYAPATWMLNGGNDPLMAIIYRSGVKENFSHNLTASGVDRGTGQ
jgi:hypothetical protein